VDFKLIFQERTRHKAYYIICIIKKSASHKLQYNFISIAIFILLINLNITYAHNITFVVFENYDEHTSSLTTLLLTNGRVQIYHTTEEKKWMQQTCKLLKHILECKNDVWHLFSMFCQPNGKMCCISITTHTLSPHFFGIVNFYASSKLLFPPKMTQWCSKTTNANTLYCNFSIHFRMWYTNLTGSLSVSCSESWHSLSDPMLATRQSPRAQAHLPGTRTSASHLIVVATSPLNPYATRTARRTPSCR
jgi:hypothetical protein